MKVVVHTPTTEEGIAKMQERIAEGRANMIISIINRLDMPYEKKIELLESVRESLRKEIEEEKKLARTANSREPQDAP